MSYLKLRCNDLKALINQDNQQLVSLQFHNHELMHGGGYTERKEDHPGWQNSEITMFPIVGPVSDHKVRWNKQHYPMAQHGIVRHLNYDLIRNSDQEAHFKVSYTANTPVRNLRAQAADDPKHLLWPFSFEIKKSYRLTTNQLAVDFRIKNGSSGPHPYNFGWHPAFKTYANCRFPQLSLVPSDIEQRPGNVIKLAQESIDFHSGAYMVRLSNTIGGLMLWRPPGSELVCIEPVTNFPNQEKSFHPFKILDHKPIKYTVNISIFNQAGI